MTQSVSPHPSVRFMRSCLAALAIVTVLAHLSFGLYYMTRVYTTGNRLTLEDTGDAYLSKFTGWGGDYEVDSAGYNRAALGAMQTGVPRMRQGTISFRSLIYDYFLAGCYKVGGIRLISVAVPQALLAGLTCWFLGLAAGRLMPERPSVMLWAGGLVLLNLRLAMYVGFIYPTLLLVSFLSVALWSATWPVGPRRTLGMAIPLIFGTYSQGAFFIVTTAAAVWFSWEYLRRRHGWDVVGVLALAAAVGLKLTLTAVLAQGGHGDLWLRDDRGRAQWYSNNPYYESMGWWDLWEARPGNPHTQWHVSPEETQRHQQYLTEAGGDELVAVLRWIRDNPVAYVRLCFVRLRAELGPFTGQMSRRHQQIAAMVWALIFPAGYIGLWLSRKKPVAQFGWVQVVCSVTFFSLWSTCWYLRYRLPTELTLTLFAAIAYATLCSRLVRPRNTSG